MSQEAEPPLAHSLNLHADIARRLAASMLPPAVRALVDGALSGLHTEDAASVGGVYLKSVAAKGFRGVGPETRLEFRPGPGLTVVTGRNGSGESSFADAIDLALTGQPLRLYGDGHQRRDFTYVDDAVRATLAEPTRPSAGSQPPTFPPVCAPNWRQ